MNRYFPFPIIGYAGAVGSSDATNVVLKRCRYQVQQQHFGHKQSKTAHTYKITVNHCRYILATRKGHPCTWNNKTLIRYNEFVSGLHNGMCLPDVAFFLFERVDGTIKKRKYTGAWVLTDNGYLPWSVTMPPLKYGTSSW